MQINFTVVSVILKILRGWLLKFQQYYNISHQHEHGKKDDADVGGENSWKENALPELLKRYFPDKIYNPNITEL